MKEIEDLLEEYEDSDYEFEEYKVCENCEGALLKGYSVELGCEYFLCVDCKEVFPIR